MALPAGTQVYGQDLPPTQYDQDWTVILNIVGTGYVPGTPEVGVNFTAPTSGRVLVTIGAGVRNNAATGERAIVTFQVFQDNANGPAVVGASFNSGVVSAGVAVAQEFHYIGTFKMVQNLTPGRNYYARVVHRTSSITVAPGTADIASRDICVIPLT